MTKPRVSIPFLPEWREKMLGGVKICTCRSEAYGQPGDQFTIFGAVFELTAVWQTTLEDVATNYYKQEGCASSDEYIAVWNKIHRRRGYVPTDVKWLHKFKRVDTAPRPQPGDGGLGTARWNG